MSAGICLLEGDNRPEIFMHLTGREYFGKYRRLFFFIIMMAMMIRQARPLLSAKEWK